MVSSCSAGGGRGVLGRLPSKLLARRLSWGRLSPFALLAFEPTKPIVRPRRFRPVEARFFLKSLWLGRLLAEERSRCDEAISRPASLGDGGELERVVAEERFMEKRRRWVARGLPLV